MLRRSSRSIQSLACRRLRFRVGGAKTRQCHKTLSQHLIDCRRHPWEKLWKGLLRMPPCPQLSIKHIYSFSFAAFIASPPDAPGASGCSTAERDSCRGRGSAEECWAFGRHASGTSSGWSLQIKINKRLKTLSGWFRWEGGRRPLKRGA